MVNSINNYQNIGLYNQYFKLNSLNRNNSLTDTINTAKSIFKRNTYNLYDKNNASFIDGYTSTLASLKEFTSKLDGSNKNSLWNNFSASSTDTNVLNAKTFFTPKEKAKYTINVTQIAAAQKNTSNALVSTDKATIKNADLTISINDKAFKFNIDATDKTNEEMYKDLAGKINKSDIGVYATVKKDKDKSILEIVGDKTGEKETFSVTATEDFSLLTNLSNLSQIAKDAVYDVTKDDNPLSTIHKTSSSNEIDVDGFKVSATLKGAGKATINVDVDTSKVTEAVKNFASAYNKSVSFLENNIDMGSAVSRSLNKLGIADTYAKNLEKIGITYNSDKTISVDEKKLNKALTDDTDNVERILGSRYSVMSNLSNKVTSALQEPSINLINKSLYNTSNTKTSSSYDLSSNNSFLNQIKLLGLYNKNGQFGIMNYNAVGLLLNTYI